IYFGKKNIVENGIFMIGDSGGVIAPLAGDGIGIAMQSGKLIADLFLKKRNENLSDNEMELLFKKSWYKLFSGRMRKAKIIQNIILKNFTRNSGFFIARKFPSLLSYLIESTRN
ncbi:MAG TPA: hypothetical protein VLN45_04625, partial [Ignavibacteriaceae bacterium]|nr:hypothetical protein [Ignavibacteriaceae bacterium]